MIGFFDPIADRAGVCPDAAVDCAFLTPPEASVAAGLGTEVGCFAADGLLRPSVGVN